MAIKEKQKGRKELHTPELQILPLHVGLLQ